MENVKKKIKIYLRRSKSKGGLQVGKERGRKEKNGDLLFPSPTAGYLVSAEQFSKPDQLSSLLEAPWSFPVPFAAPETPRACLCTIFCGALHTSLYTYISI